MNKINNNKLIHYWTLTLLFQNYWFTEMAILYNFEFAIDHHPWHWKLTLLSNNDLAILIWIAITN